MKKKNIRHAFKNNNNQFHKISIKLTFSFNNPMLQNPNN